MKFFYMTLYIHLFLGLLHKTFNYALNIKYHVMPPLPFTD